MSKHSEITDKYLNRLVIDKDGIKATVTAVREIKQRQPGKETGVQMVLNGSVKMGWMEFDRLRKFRLMESDK